MKTLFERVIDSDKIGKHEKDLLRQAILVRAQNVADYFWMGTGKEEWDLAKDFPNWAPPFENFFVEYRVATQVRMGDDIVRTLHEDNYLFGVHAFYVDADEYIAAVTDEKIKNDIDVGARWLLHAIPYGARGNELPYPYIGGGYVIPVFSDGSVPPGEHVGGGNILGFSLSGELSPEQLEKGGHILTSNCGPTWLSISLMHCKNVELIERGPQTKPASKRNRHGPRIKYYTLEIEPMKKVLRTEGESEKTGLKRALHICRGHFATYSDDKPLFGKYSGTFWKPMHVKGSKVQGEVVKDYEVKL